MPKMIHGYAAQSAKTPLAPFQFSRRDLRPHDVQIEILFCGVCHSDLHAVKNEWNNTIYPVVPGHEIVGKVIAIGGKVTSFKKGDFAAVGCLVDSCRTCAHCKEDLQQYCDNGITLTYNSLDRVDQSVTYGGYSKEIVVDEKFVLQIPKKFKESDFPGVAPLLCAGITTYSPLRHWNVQKGQKVGVAGLGGLGHMAIKLSASMGAHVTLFTTSSNKIEDAKRLGANEVVISKNPQEMKKHANSFDFILNTIAAQHNLDSFIDLLNVNGVMCLVGIPAIPHASPNYGNLIFRRKSLVGSLIGGIKETQEMLNYCAANAIVSDVEIIPIQKINEAYERMLKSDVKYRFVIDMNSF